MSDWNKLNKCRVRTGQYASDEADGFNGFFCLTLRGEKVKCIASDGEGWQHVSVSIDRSNQPPSWAIMCDVKELFWEPEDCAMQLHPPRSNYVNVHPGCLHIWRPLNVTRPQPPKEFV